MNKSWVVIHHSATVDGQTFSWGSIRKFHMLERRWRDIGYHLGTELVGDTYENILGRQWDDHGAHCPQGGMNAIGLGWCIVGNFDVLAPAPQLWTHLVLTANYLSRFLRIPPERFIGHAEAQAKWGTADKTCPGKRFPLDALRAAIRET